MRKCGKCGADKTGNHTTYCKKCYNALKREHYHRNRSKQIARVMAYNAAHIEDRRRRQRESWHRKGLQTYRLWRDANRDAAQCNNNRNSVRKRGYTIERRGGLLSSEWKEIKDSHENRCAYCGERKRLTIDHRVPLKRGGKHVASNIIPACSSCNSKKSYMTEEEYRTRLVKNA